MTPKPQEPQREATTLEVKCARFAEVFADGGYLPIDCDLVAGHVGPHRWSFRVVADSWAWPKSAWWTDDPQDLRRATQP